MGSFCSRARVHPPSNGCPPTGIRNPNYGNSPLQSSTSRATSNGGHYGSTESPQSGTHPPVDQRPRLPTHASPSTPGSNLLPSSPNLQVITHSPSSHQGSNSDLPLSPSDANSPPFDPFGLFLTHPQPSSNSSQQRFSRSTSSSNNNPPEALVQDLAQCPFCGSIKSLAEIHTHVTTQHTLKDNCQVNRYRLDHAMGECVICLDEMLTDQQVALLPCTCVFHDECLEQWFQKQGWCPNHPALGIQSFDLVTSYSV